MTNVEGPNTRFCIWVQGCSIHCKGCANSTMWDMTGGTVYDTLELINLIKAYKDKIDGITWLGGEPTEQIKAVTEVSKAVQNMGLSVLVFTGYVYSQLKDNLDFQELIKYVDILIDGQYEQDKADYSRAWVGSSNQKYYFLSDRYNESDITTCKNKFEVRITSDNKIIITGMGNYKKLAGMMR